MDRFRPVNLFAGSIPAPALKSRSGFVVNVALAFRAGSIDSLSPESSPFGLPARLISFSIFDYVAHATQTRRCLRNRVLVDHENLVSDLPQLVHS
jgi:hypothetical protein